MLKLIVDETSAADPIMPIRWCLSPEDLEWIANNTDDPHLLVVAINSRKLEVFRYVVPLGTMMESLQFHRPGKYRIQAAVVWGGGEKGIKKHLLNTNHRRSYAVDVIDDDGNLRSDMGCRRFQHAELKVEVAKEFFAKEPAEWEKRWVNFWFTYSAVDQCQFRKRRIIAYTLQLIVLSLFFPIFWFLKSVIATLMVVPTLLFHIPWEAKEILAEYWANIRHPWANDIADLKDEIRKSGSFILWKEKGVYPEVSTKEAERPWYVLIFYPVFLCIISIVCFVLGWGMSKIIGRIGVGFTHETSLLGLFVFGFFVVASFVTLLWLIITAMAKKEVNIQEGDEEATEEHKARITALKEELAILACDRAGSASLRELPAEKRTFHLRFENLKAKVCRPYAQ